MNSSSSSTGVVSVLNTSLSSSSSSTLLFNLTTNCTLLALNLTNCSLPFPSPSSSSSSSLAVATSSPATSSPVNASSSSTANYIVASSPSEGLFSVDAVFLSTVLDIWVQIIVWTMVGCAFVFLSAGVHGVRCNSDARTSHVYYAIVPPLVGVFGGFVGFIHGCVTAALIGAVAVSINTSVGIGTAAGLGLGQAIIICWFHLGRADFIHR